MILILICLLRRARRRGGAAGVSSSQATNAPPAHIAKSRSHSTTKTNNQNKPGRTATLFLLPQCLQFTLKFEVVGVLRDVRCHAAFRVSRVQVAGERRRDDPVDHQVLVGRDRRIDAALDLGVDLRDNFFAMTSSSRIRGHNFVAKTSSSRIRGHNFVVIISSP